MSGAYGFNPSTQTSDTLSCRDHDGVSSVRNDSHTLDKLHFSKLVRLDRAWRRGEPEQVRQECDSFVLSLEIIETAVGKRSSDQINATEKEKAATAMRVVIGLNNGDIEEWDLISQAINCYRATRKAGNRFLREICLFWLS